MNEVEAALRAILREPFGCPFCDSGKLRTSDKPHTSDCGFNMAEKALGHQTVERINQDCFLTELTNAADDLIANGPKFGAIVQVMREAAKRIRALKEAPHE